MSGKSHERAEAVVEAMILNPDCKVVCIREIQKSLTFSAKALIESKIRSMEMAFLFDIQDKVIKRRGGTGICIFQGMQDHTADSVKSLEGFDIAWIEEAQSLSAKSLRLLRPTIVRKKGAEIWATWNPSQPEDAIEVFAKNVENDDSAVIVHVNFDQNKFLDPSALEEIDADRKRYPEDFDHVYLGAYDFRSELRVFKHWREEECAPTDKDDLYYGADWGFANDPTVLLRAWLDKPSKTIYVDQQVDGVGVEIDHTPDLFDKIPEARKYKIRADSARPETISFISRRGFRIEGVEKGKGSVEDGIEWLRSYDIIVHPRCKLLLKELRLYSYRENKVGDILPKVEDANNHCIDALRYAFEPLIKKRGIDYVKMAQF